MIYLKNLTKYKDKELLKVLRYVERKIGVEGNTYIEIRPSRYYYGNKGTAHHGWKIDFGKYRKITFNNGLGLAYNFLNTSLHELAHIKDFRDNKYFHESRTKSGRRIAHDKRPCEISAYNQIYDVQRHNKRKEQEVILNFALEVERVMKGGKK
jgi:hypothetical protein